MTTSERERGETAPAWLRVGARVRCRVGAGRAGKLGTVIVAPKQIAGAATMRRVRRWLRETRLSAAGKAATT